MILGFAPAASPAVPGDDMRCWSTPSRGAAGTAFCCPGCTTFRAREVRLHAPGIIGYADGERIGPLPLEFSCVPGAVRLLR